MKALLRKLNLPRKIANQQKFKANLAQGLVAVEIRNTIGFGARLGWVLEVLAFCDENNLSPCFRFTYPGSDTDYFSRFFLLRNTVQTPLPRRRFVSIYTIGELDLGKNYDRVLTIERATRLIDKYLGIREEITQEVEQFQAAHFRDYQVLGVHYRGTDKSAEAEKVPFEAVPAAIERFRDLLPRAERIFVSTDDANFLRYLDSSALGERVIFRRDSYRAADNIPIHRSGRDMYEINRDALVNCLLLSRCQGLIKTASVLSAWSLLFNPQMPFIMLNRPFDDYFPERELLKKALHNPS